MEKIIEKNTEQARFWLSHHKDLMAKLEGYLLTVKYSQDLDYEEMLYFCGLEKSFMFDTDWEIMNDFLAVKYEMIGN